MGHLWFDQFSILHFATGVVAYFWGISLYVIMMIHILFELFENTTYGIWFIDEWVPFWPGGKSHPDSLLNCITDTLFTGVGWIISFWLDKVYTSKYAPRTRFYISG